MSTAPQGADFLKEWNRGDEIGIVIDDITKEDRTNFQINEMFSQLQEVVKKYGFDFKMWGLKTNFEQSINKNLSKDKEALLKLASTFHGHAYVTTEGKVLKIDSDDIDGIELQNTLIHHNLLLKNELSGEITLNKK